MARRKEQKPMEERKPPIKIRFKARRRYLEELARREERNREHPPGYFERIDRQNRIGEPLLYGKYDFRLASPGTTEEWQAMEDAIRFAVFNWYARITKDDYSVDRMKERIKGDILDQIESMDAGFQRRIESFVRKGVLQVMAYAMVWGKLEDVDAFRKYSKATDEEVSQFIIDKIGSTDSILFNPIRIAEELKLPEDMIRRIADVQGRYQLSVDNKAGAIAAMRRAGHDATELSLDLYQELLDAGKLRDAEALARNNPGLGEEMARMASDLRRGNEQRAD
jgi:hypothetical protein